MATVYLTEFANTGRDAAGYKMQCAHESQTASQTVAITAGSVQSAAFNALTKFVRISTDAVCSVEFGTAPTATATTRRLPANTSEYFSVHLNGGFKVAVITNS